MRLLREARARKLLSHLHKPPKAGTDAQQFRSLLTPIAKTTIANEPECLAYAWFISDEINEVPTRYMRGFEVLAWPLSHPTTPDPQMCSSSVDTDVSKGH
jgi:hypothetical protein